MNSIITTLFEGDYILGLGALVNSLYAHKFRGTVYAGFRGTLTGWAAAAIKKGDYFELEIASDLVLRFVPIEPGWHLANLKPTFMLDVMDKWEPTSDMVCYFDPDIVVKHDWEYFEDWTKFGVSLCQEMLMAIAAQDHPLILEWKDWAVRNGYRLVRTDLHALNSGYVAVPRIERGFLELWCEQMQLAGRDHPMDYFAPGSRRNPFFLVDQDVINVTSVTYEGRISRIGPEGMDFAPGGFTMSHAAGGSKPWRKKFVRCALGGVSPTLADKGWAANLDKPIQVLPLSKSRGINRSIRTASAIGRFISRS